MALGKTAKKATGIFKKNAYEDVEGLTVSLGVIFALLLPGSMTLQNQGFDDGVQSKNFLLVMCTRKDFRSLVVQTLDDNSTGNAFEWNVSLGGGKTLDTRAVLTDDSLWKWDGGHPESIYLCGHVKELAATARIVSEAFNKWQFDSWVLMNDPPLWSDNVNGMTSFAMSIFIAGLLGSLGLYISLSLSAAREDASGAALESWAQIGFPALMGLKLCLGAALILFLLANDAYTESQDTFFLRSVRAANYSKIALIVLFTPLCLGFIVGSAVALVRSHKATPKAKEPGTEEAGRPGQPEGQAGPDVFDQGIRTEHQRV